jgi:sec-independent protein translocase protein TatA
MITGHWYMIVVLLLIVLIFYGPGKLPEIGGAVGKAMREFRKSVDSVKREANSVAQATGPTSSETSSPSAASEAAEPATATPEASNAGGTTD